MKPLNRVLIFLTALVLAAVTAWLGVQVASDREARAARFYEAVVKSRLAEVNGLLSAHLASVRESLTPALTAAGAQILAGDPSGGEGRRFVMTNPLVKGILVQDEKGVTFHPGQNPTGQELDFLDRLGAIADSGLLLAEMNPADGNDRATLAPGGWHPWFRETGLGLILWARLPGGGVAGAEISMARLKADFICLDPASAAEKASEDMRISILDSRNSPILSWGGFSPRQGTRPFIEKSLDPPLSAWKAACHLSPDVIDANEKSRRISLSLILGLTLLGLFGSALFIYREWNREVLEATQRVNFVNQVSHELRSPLTNIRLHAELLDNSIADDDSRGRERLEIIGAECRRLTRMIDNILTFGRQQRNAMDLIPSEWVPDRVVESTLELFGPGLREKGIEPSLRLFAERPVMVDKDALEQILGVLLSNVLKYASCGGFVGVSTGQRGDFTEILVQDHGPGIPLKSREEIFLPFVRLKDGIAEGASGAGIGLSIARELAVLHGGGLSFGFFGEKTGVRSFEGSPQGAAFLVQLRTPAPNRDEADGDSKTPAGSNETGGEAG